MTKIRIAVLRKAACTFLMIACLGGGALMAQTPPEVEVERDTDELKVLVLPDPGRTMTDSALVFTNPGGSSVAVRCKGYTAQGVLIGRTKTTVPANGLRYIRASDLGNGITFLGSAKCWAARYVIGTGYIVTKDGLTATRVVSNRNDSTEHFRFPVVGYF